MESYICTACTISDFFWYVNGTNLVYRSRITLWKCQDTQILFILEGILY